MKLDFLMNIDVKSIMTYKTPKAYYNLYNKPEV